jgi:hypothetical protein
MELRLAGTSGALRVGYAEAATLSRWSLETIGPSLYKLHGRVERAVPVYLAMRPLRLVLRVGALDYAWEVESLDCDGERLEAWVTGDPTLGRASS